LYTAKARLSKGANQENFCPAVADYPAAAGQQFFGSFFSLFA
jgi:hypothetical protein